MNYRYSSIITSSIRSLEAMSMADGVLTANHSNIRGCVEADQ